MGNRLRPCCSSSAIPRVRGILYERGAARAGIIFCARRRETDRCRARAGDCRAGARFIWFHARLRSSPWRSSPPSSAEASASVSTRSPSEYWTGQTLGKRIAGLQVVRESGALRSASDSRSCDCSRSRFSFIGSTCCLRSSPTAGSARSSSCRRRASSGRRLGRARVSSLSASLPFHRAAGSAMRQSSRQRRSPRRAAWRFGCRSGASAQLTPFLTKLRSSVCGALDQSQAVEERAVAGRLVVAGKAGQQRECGALLELVGLSGAPSRHLGPRMRGTDRTA